MLKIRQNVFETNSSSCHSLIIRKDDWFDELSHSTDNRNFTVKGDYFGRGHMLPIDSVQGKLDYIWTMVVGLFGKEYVDWQTKTVDYADKPRFEKWKNMILAICPNADLIEPAVDDYDVGIDHVRELMPFAEACEENPDLLRYFLISYSWIDIAGDELPCWPGLLPYPWGELVELNEWDYLFVKGN